MNSELETSVECAIVNLLFARAEIADEDADAIALARAIAHINEAIAELKPFASAPRHRQPSTDRDFTTGAPRR